MAVSNTNGPNLPQPGDALPVFERHTGLENWNRYAAVSDEFADTHMDDEIGRAAGYPGAFGMGDLQVAYFHNVLRTWLGTRGRIVRVTARFHNPNLKNTVVRIEGSVREVGPIERSGEHAVTLDLVARSTDGLILSTATAHVVRGAG